MSCIPLYIGLARTIYMRCTYGIFGLEITKYTVYIYVYIRFWLTLVIYSTKHLMIYIKTRSEAFSSEHRASHTSMPSLGLLVHQFLCMLTPIEHRALSCVCCVFSVTSCIGLHKTHRKAHMRLLCLLCACALHLHACIHMETTRHCTHPHRVRFCQGCSVRFLGARVQLSL